MVESCYKHCFLVLTLGSRIRNSRGFCTPGRLMDFASPSTAAPPRPFKASALQRPSWRDPASRETSRVSARRLFDPWGAGHLAVLHALALLGALVLLVAPGSPAPAAGVFSSSFFVRRRLICFFFWGGGPWVQKRTQGTAHLRSSGSGTNKS